MDKESNKSKIKKIFITIYSIIFLSIVFIPFFLTGALYLHLTNRSFQGFDLNGYFNTYEKPDFSKRNYIKGKFQKDFEAWFNTNVSYRGFYIRMYNQIQFSLFKVSNHFIGKNNDIFEKEYIDAECGLVPECDFSNPENYQKLTEYVNHLENIQNKLQKVGKYFLFYTTPSKAAQNYDDIPLKYRLKKPEGYKSPYYYLKGLVSGRNINYIDSRDFSSKDGIPDFYTTGIHWARPIEQRVSQAIVENLSMISNKKLPKIILKELVSSDTPIKRDADVFNLANLLQGPPKTKYYEYEAEIQTDSEPLMPKFLIQGGSFAEGFYYVYDYVDYCSESYKFFYNLIYRKRNEPQIQMSKWDEIDFNEILDNVDYVIIELNEAVINYYSNGFVEYLDSFLDTYGVR